MRFLILILVINSSLFSQEDPFLMIDHFTRINSQEEMADFLMSQDYDLSENSDKNRLILMKGQTTVTLNIKECDHICISSNNYFFKQSIEFEYQNLNSQSIEVNFNNLSRLQWEDSSGKEYFVLLKDEFYEIYYRKCKNKDSSK